MLNYLLWVIYRNTSMTTKDRNLEYTLFSDNDMPCFRRVQCLVLGALKPNAHSITPAQISLNSDSIVPLIMSCLVYLWQFVMLPGQQVYSLATSLSVDLAQAPEECVLNTNYLLSLLAQTQLNKLSCSQNRDAHTWYRCLL